MKTELFVNTRDANGKVTGFMPRDTMIEAILNRWEQSERNMDEGVQRFELMGTDGKWHGPAGFPIGVTMTGEKRGYWVSYSRCLGTTAGKRFDSKEAFEAHKTAHIERDRAEFKANLDQMDETRLLCQFQYWVK